MYYAKVIADSVNKFATRATTVEVCYPRIILAELNTHRMFSRNTSSSRAIPVMTLIKQVWNKPFIPTYWGKNKAGMQAKEELTGYELLVAKGLWLAASKFACGFAYLFSKIGLHKQIANRIIEPWMWTKTIITATEWDNFFELRNHPDAQPEIKKLAELIEEAIAESKPKFLFQGQWHLPYVTAQEKNEYSLNECLKFSAARCARVSYLTHDKQMPSLAHDILLHDMLVGTDPKHASPVEHQLTVASDEKFYYNVRSFKSYRWFIENGKHISE